MANINLASLLKIYNPWWHDIKGSWRGDLPDYERPIVNDILNDLDELRQMISITGPRRVGKTTAARQIICRLLDDQNVDPHRILYFSFDDPEVFGSEDLQRIIFDHLIKYTGVRPGDKVTWYFFLDEIQRLPKWELYLKKYYDLKSPVRFVVSGSASSPIFRSSQESLLGRIKDRHLLPFSFREFCLFRLKDNPLFSYIISNYCDLRHLLMARKGEEVVETIIKLDANLTPLEKEIDSAVISYCREGGFPEVWQLSDPVRKIEYLMEQQVRKVLYDDLMSVTQYRKPENVLRFFVYLLAHPGMEINTSNVASSIGVERRVIEDNLPRLIMTDLIIRIEKFTHQPLRVRKGNFKCYSVDLALRNAVLKTWDDYTSDPDMMGLYAENLVVQELCKWPEAIEVSFYREKDKEVDFIVTCGGSQYLPLEVKHRKSRSRVTGLKHFMRKYGLNFGVIIIRGRNIRFEEGILYLPLRYFLLTN
ncbi:MAG: ATP-binding protein [Syntrophobacterales bacterium]|nr:MAG: ATP-binding protein [Syntrophobacterales bacterium]